MNPGGGAGGYQGVPSFMYAPTPQPMMMYPMMYAAGGAAAGGQMPGAWHGQPMMMPMMPQPQPQLMMMAPMPYMPMQGMSALPAARPARQSARCEPCDRVFPSHAALQQHVVSHTKVGARRVRLPCAHPGMHSAQSATFTRWAPRSRRTACRRMARRPSGSTMRRTLRPGAPRAAGALLAVGTLRLCFGGG
jgi:hypothetical protein